VSEDPWARTGPAPPLSREQRRRRLLVVALLAGALIAGLAITTAEESVPSGATSMPGMDMGSGMSGGEITLRDIEGDSFTLPGGREGLIMFMSTRGCGGCVETARTVAAAAQTQDPPLPLTIVSVDTEESREDFERFDEEAGGLDARYALDDASGSIASHFGIRELNTVLRYGAQGLTTRIFEPGPDQITTIQSSFGG
jgi:hypothetical protein